MSGHFGPGEVYFLACPTLGAIKIGFTRQGVSNRLSALQTGCPAPLKVIGRFPGTVDDERRLHAAFRALHIHGEWFRWEGKLVDLACYIGETNDRGVFEDAVHDALASGLWHHTSHLTEAQYCATGSAAPFRDLLKNYQPESAQ